MKIFKLTYPRVSREVPPQYKIGFWILYHAGSDPENFCKKNHVGIKIHVSIKEVLYCFFKKSGFQIWKFLIKNHDDELLSLWATIFEKLSIWVTIFIATIFEIYPLKLLSLEAIIFEIYQFVATIFDENLDFEKIWRVLSEKTGNYRDPEIKKLIKNHKISQDSGTPRKPEFLKKQ